ncbi:hypothetical protein [Pseudoclavibacter sp. CFCC 13611]|uniref:hypothetical protein n=1 Tax=Pseudoclavibacter sp. CFCC 13611 TaxID=2615178 RepID=UPI0013018381|nr:hypothetical protein [Pseudoclavibacter sp. CFCC 13611]KAB1662759.1 hypothetical protein F8O08_09310 [Pseudoclavibacter sp. CFCC 13611]
MSLSARIWAMSLIARPVTPTEKPSKKGGFIRKMSPAEKLVLLVIADLENIELGYAYPTLQQLGEKACCTPEYARRVVNMFAEIGWVRIAKEKYGRAEHANNRYYLPKVPNDIRAKDDPWMAARDRNGDPLDDVEPQFVGSPP